MIGGYKPYVEALDEIFEKFNHKDPNKSIKRDTDILESILQEKNISPYHGIEHAKTVMYHAWCALRL